MSLGGAAANRVNDGSDFQYRMLVDDRYKKAAQYRTNLSQLTSAQCFYALVSGLLSAALLARPVTDPLIDEAGEHPWWQTYTTATAHVQSLTLLEALPLYVILITAIAGLVGLFAVKGNKPSPLRFQSLLSAVAACLAVWPIFSGAPISAISSEYASAQSTQDHTWFIIVLVQSMQDFLGLGVNVAVAILSQSLAFTMTSPKKLR